MTLQGSKRRAPTLTCRAVAMRGRGGETRGATGGALCVKEEYVISNLRIYFLFHRHLYLFLSRSGPGTLYIVQKNNNSHNDKDSSEDSHSTAPEKTCTTITVKTAIWARDFAYRTLAVASLDPSTLTSEECVNDETGQPEDKDKEGMDVNLDVMGEKFSKQDI